MQEAEPMMYGSADQAFVWNEIGKAVSLMTHYMHDEWQQWELSQLDGGTRANQDAERLNSSVEPTKEPQPRLRLSGTVEHAPTFRLTRQGVPRLDFPLTEHNTDTDGNPTTQWHNVYQTKHFALETHQLELKQGEEVSVIGVRHQREQLGQDGKPLTDATGTILQEATIYAYNVRRLEEGGE